MEPMNTAPLSTPDITPIQQLTAAVGALLVAAMGAINAFGVYDVTGEQSAAVLGLWASFGGVLVIADAVIRNGRARAFINQPKGAVAEVTTAGEDSDSRTTLRRSSGPGA